MSSNGDLHKQIEKLMLKSPKPRLMTISAADNGDGSFDLIYWLHHNNTVLDIRYKVTAEEELDDASDLWLGAINMEREIIDLLGLKFQGQVGGLLLVKGKSPENPLRKKEVQ
ncbi:MAG: NADH-quinone oxidoreductase subunit C [Methanomassiliicoccales archaeon]